MKKIAIVVIVPLIMFFMTPPDGLSTIAWRLFAIYLGTILGLICKPYPEPVVLLAAISASAIVIGNTPNDLLKINDVLDGYRSGTTWLVFSAFTMSSAFVVTGLGKRIAYNLISAMGSTVLKLGYVSMILDLILAPATPSNTARSGGIIFPISNSLALALGSDPQKSPKKAGRYLLLNVYMGARSSSYLFITAMAPNALALSMIAPILNINLDWTQWFIAASVPGFICLLLTPLVCYYLCPPELKKVSNKEIAKRGLDELGPMSGKEKLLVILFISALLGWIFTKQLGINATIVAVFTMAACVILNIVSWEKVASNKGGWSTLIWYGGIIGMSGLLTASGFFTWLSDVIAGVLKFDGSPHLALISILLASMITRYFFASTGAFTAAMLPVLAMVGMVSGAPPMLLGLGLLFSNSYGGGLTHYGSAVGPIIMGAGYNDIKSWWIVGTVVGFGSLIVHCTIGFAWFEFIMKMGWI